MSTGGDRLRRRRCISLRIAFLFGIVLAVFSRGDIPLLTVALIGLCVVAIVFWRDCRDTRHGP
jgi:uncharacterized membrane protein